MFWFPDGVTLETGAAVLVHSGPDTVDAPRADLLWTKDFMWDDASDWIELCDGRGEVVRAAREGSGWAVL